MSVHEGRGIGRQENAGADKLFDLAPAAGRRALLKPCRKGFVGDEGCVERRVEVTRRNGVALQAVFGPVGRHALRQIADSALGGGVGRDAGAGKSGLDAGDVDDLAAAAADHMTCGSLTGMENRGDVGLQQALEGIRRKILKRCAVLHAGIVDENIDGADIRLETVDGLAHRFMIGGVEGERPCALDACGSRFQLRLVAAVQNHFSPCFRQPLRQREADALGRTRDQGAAAGKIEQIKAHCFLQSLDIAFMQVYVIDNIHPFQTWMSRLKRPVSVRIGRAERLRGA